MELGVKRMYVFLDGIVVGTVVGAQKGPATVGAVVLTAGMQQVTVEEERITCTENNDYDEGVSEGVTAYHTDLV